MPQKENKIFSHFTVIRKKGIFVKKERCNVPFDPDLYTHFKEATANKIKCEKSVLIQHDR
ncbi:hypothetical protein T06_4743 [Trichinella sp. T6]|nr:hypothetical protein T06_4743 [Trichinella sp. T6]